MIKKIKLSKQTTIVIETVQPGENLSNEISISLQSGDVTQDLLLVREKLVPDPDHLTVHSDPNQIEVAVWDDPNKENYTQRIAINKRTYQLQNNQPMKRR